MIASLKEIRWVREAHSNGRGSELYPQNHTPPKDPYHFFMMNISSKLGIEVNFLTF